MLDGQLAADPALLSLQTGQFYNERSSDLLFLGSELNSDSSFTSFSLLDFFVSSGEMMYVSTQAQQCAGASCAVA